MLQYRLAWRILAGTGYGSRSPRTNRGGAQRISGFSQVRRVECVISRLDENCWKAVAAAAEVLGSAVELAQRFPGFGQFLRAECVISCSGMSDLARERPPSRLHRPRRDSALLLPLPPLLLQSRPSRLPALPASVQQRGRKL